MVIIGIDPGGTTGVGWLRDSIPSEMTEVDKDDLLEWLGDGLLGVDVVVVENYRLRPGSFQTWSEVMPIRQIGAIQLRAHQMGIPVVIQESACKPKGYALLGLKYVKGKKGMHRIDGLAHAAYYANSVLKTRITPRLGAQ